MSDDTRRVRRHKAHTMLCLLDREREGEKLGGIGTRGGVYIR
jgi:hypothetical protein